MGLFALNQMAGKLIATGAFEVLPLAGTAHNEDLLLGCCLPFSCGLGELLPDRRT